MHMCDAGDPMTAGARPTTKTRLTCTVAIRPSECLGPLSLWLQLHPLATLALALLEAITLNGLVPAPSSVFTRAGGDAAREIDP